VRSLEGSFKGERFPMSDVETEDEATAFLA
jgi:hypothetical protein